MVEKEAYLLELCRYVVLNPLRVRLRKEVGQWRWSSYKATAGLDPVPEFLTVEWVLGHFGQERGQAQARYRAFVREGVRERPWEEVRRQIYLGREEFIESHTKGGEEIREVPKEQWRGVRPRLAEIFRKRGGRAIEVAYREYGYRLREVAEYLGVHYATVSRRLKGLEREEARNV